MLSLTLQCLILRDNDLGDEGIVALAEAVSTNTSITHINLSNTSCGEKGCIALAAAVAEKNQVGN
jgi:Ran GTPase-activating protein (RanGAP) involved in mRNA processing and transport